MLLLKQNITILLMVMFSSSVVFAKPTVNYCQTCLDVSEFIQEMEYNQTESIVKQNFFKICLKENEGSNSKACEFLSATMQNTLKRIGDKNFCAKVNACTSGESILKSSAHNSEKCLFCTKLLESFKSLVAESNINLVKESLNYYCELTNDFKYECQKNVNNHLINFIDFLQNKVDSQTICHAIDSCESEISYEKKLPSIGDLVSLRDPIQIADHLDFIEQQEKLALVNSTGYKNPVTCLVCNEVVSIMYSKLHKNATRKHIEQILAKSCKTIFLRDKVKERDCEKKVEKNAEIIIKGFMDKVKPRVVCILMGMCFPGQKLPGDEQLTNAQEISTSSLSRPIQLAQSFKCYFCDKIVEFLFKELDQNKTREYVRHLLDKSCSVLFKKGDRESKCEEYVNAYTDKLINLIEKVENPGLICNVLHMCTVNTTLVNAWDDKRLNNTLNTLIKNEFSSVPLLGDDMTCDLCKQNFPKIHKFFQQKGFRDFVRNALLFACNYDEKPEECKKRANQTVDDFTNEKTADKGCSTICEESSLNTLIKNEFKKSSSMKNDLDFKLDWCQICTISYPIVNELVQIDAVRDEIKVLTNEFCDSQVLPIKDCRAKVDKYIDIIARVKNSNTGCKQLDLCPENKLSIDHNLQIIDLELIDSLDQQNLQKLGGLECTTCKMLVKDIYEKLNHIIHSDITDHLINSTCELIPQDEFKEECKKNGFKALEEMVNVLTKSLPPQQVCELLNYCKPKSTNNFLPLLNYKKNSSIQNLSECTVCQTSMVIIDATFSNPHTQESIEIFFKNFCDSRKGKFKSTCNNMLKNSLPKFYEIIKNLTNHDNGFCVKMGICNSSKMFDTSNLDIFLKDDLLKGAEKLIPSVDELIGNQYSVSCPKCVCDGCKKIMGLVHEEVLSQRELKDQILESLLKTCPPNDDACRKFYRKYVNGVYDTIERNTRPGKACETLHLCPHGLELLEPVEEKFTPTIKLTENDLCQDCKKVMAIVHDKVVSEKELKDRILESLLHVCPKHDDECRKFFKNNINYLYDLIKKDTNPEKACAALKFCNDFELFEPVMEEFVPSTNSNDSKLCEGCRSAIKYLATKLKDKVVVDKILEEFEINFCNPLTFVERKACNKFVKTFGPKIINHFANKLDEHTICNKELKLCPNFLIDNTSEETSFDLTNFIQDSNCVSCVRSVEKLNNLRGDTDKQFTVEEICKDDSECSEFMFNFSDFFLNNQHNRDSVLSCTELDVCLIPGKVQLLGGNKCKYGPAYSCLSVAHADACRTTKFCQQNRWQAVEN